MTVVPLRDLAERLELTPAEVLARYPHLVERVGHDGQAVVDLADVPELENTRD